MSSQDEIQLRKILEQIEKRKKLYWICDVKVDMIPQQKAMFGDLVERLNSDYEDRIRFYLYYWGNGAWKTFIWAYVTVLMALGEDGKKFALPYIWEKKNIWVLTKSGSNVKSVIQPYLLWEGSKTRIPPEMVKKINMDNGILKGIVLTNWTEIHVKTYDQGAENLQGWNPDWIWMDEEPVDPEVFMEIIARTRRLECELMVTMTPLNWLTRVYDYFMNQSSEKVKSKSKVYLVSSLDNPFTDKTWTEWLTEEEYRLRVLGSFENPTGLVYSEFNRNRNVCPHFSPKEMGEVAYYRGIDLWVSHPTAVVYVAVDKDENVYVFDETYRSNALLKEIVEEIDKKSRGYDFEYTVRDSAAAREWLELQNLWLKTVPVKKLAKLDNELSARRWGILLINQMLKDGKLVISSRCKNLIKEFESHYYKENGKKDGEVNKVDDDLLDALRYVVFTLKLNKPRKFTYRQQEVKKKILASEFSSHYVSSKFDNL